MFFCIATVVVVAVQILRHLLCITNCLLLMFRTRVHLFPFLKHRGRPCTDPLYISIGTLEYGYTRCMYSCHISRLPGRSVFTSVRNFYASCYQNGTGSFYVLRLQVYLVFYVGGSFFWNFWSFDSVWICGLEICRCLPRTGWDRFLSGQKSAGRESADVTRGTYAYSSVSIIGLASTNGGSRCVSWIFFSAFVFEIFEILMFWFFHDSMFVLPFWCFQIL